MKVLILGIDGYLGWALKDYLEERGHMVMGFDNFSRRRRVAEIGSDSLFPFNHEVLKGDLCDYESLLSYKVDVVVDLAEQPSAPYSLRNLESAVETQQNNIVGTMNLLWWLKTRPHIHLIKLGSMGVYGTPEGDIPESDGPIAYDPGSFYHISKAADSLNLRKACQWWGLNVTDLHQGVVYGHLPETRFDYDSYFGTVINRFLTQAAVNYPLTVYGEGGQTRGYLNIKDTMRCIELAMLNPPKGYRVFNQFTEIFSVDQIAKMVQKITGCAVRHIPNPRKELEAHEYNPTHVRLPDLGLKHHKLEDEIEGIYKLVYEKRANIKREVIAPQTQWA